jgi:hypothetical protein
MMLDDRHSTRTHADFDRSQASMRKVESFLRYHVFQWLSAACRHQVSTRQKTSDRWLRRPSPRSVQLRRLSHPGMSTGRPCVLTVTRPAWPRLVRPVPGMESNLFHKPFDHRPSRNVWFPGALSRRQPRPSTPRRPSDHRERLWVRGAQQRRQPGPSACPSTIRPSATSLGPRAKKRTCRDKFGRWGDNYVYHIGDLSAAVLTYHPK